MNLLIPVLGFVKSGGFRMISILTNGLIEKGHSVTILCPNDDLPYFPIKAEIIRYRKFDFLSNNLIIKIVNLFLGIIKLKNKNFDCVLANHSFTTFPIYFATKGVKLFYYIQAFEPDYYYLKKHFYSSILGKISELSYTLPFYQIVNADIYLNYSKIKSRDVIYPAIDFNVFFPKNRQINNKKIVVGAMIRGEKSKGAKYIIEAINLLNTKSNPFVWKLAFVDECFKSQLKNVDFVYPDGDVNLSEYYRSLDIYISAGVSQFGAIHYPVIECMACKTLVVTTPYYPANEKNAIIIEPESSNSIVNALMIAIENPFDNLIQNGFIEVSKFSIDLQTNKFENILLEHKWNLSK